MWNNPNIKLSETGKIVWAFICMYFCFMGKKIHKYFSFTEILLKVYFQIAENLFMKMEIWKVGSEFIKHDVL